ncbi:MAG TPA: hypothetical protein VK841_08515 [Polyangiaceae bacterium]|nr:hypothetical protein [Polyangiaceae bacterium]
MTLIDGGQEAASNDSGGDATCNCGITEAGQDAAIEVGSEETSAGDSGTCTLGGAADAV